MSTEGEQGALEMVHTNVFTPVPMPVTADNGSAVLEIMAEPETKDHCPVPVKAVFAFIVIALPQIV